MDRRHFMKTQLGATVFSTASVLMGASSQKKEGKNKMKPNLKAGFSKIDLSPSIESRTLFRKPLEAIFTCFEMNNQLVLLTSLDFIMINPDENLMLQQKIGKAFNVPFQNVVIHCTHTHSSPWIERGSDVKIIDLHKYLIQGFQTALDTMSIVSIKTSIQNVGKSLSVYRRGDTGDDLGVQTFWFGYHYHENDDRPDASNLVNEMKSRWFGEKINYTVGDEPVWFDGDVDPLVHAMEFFNESGKSIGCIVRFSAHPHLTCACKDYKYDPDFPGVVRDTMEKELNVPIMFLTGACGNLVPKEKVTYTVDKDNVPQFPYMGPSSSFYPVDEKELLSENERIGKTIAIVALAGLDKSSIAPINHVGFNAQDFDCPINPLLPANEEDVRLIKNVLVQEVEACRHNKNFRELRGLANRLNWLSWAPAIAFKALNAEEKKKNLKALPVSVLALNDFAFVFISSEVSVETTMALRKSYPHLNVLAFGNTNGYIGYLPTAKMIDEGGYEGRSTIIARNAEKKLRDDIHHIFVNLKLV